MSGDISVHLDTYKCPQTRYISCFYMRMSPYFILSLPCRIQTATLHPRPPVQGFLFSLHGFPLRTCPPPNTPQRTNFTLILKYITIGHSCQVLYIIHFWDSLSFGHIEKMESWFEIILETPGLFSIINFLVSQLITSH